MHLSAARSKPRHPKTLSSLQEHSSKTQANNFLTANAGHVYMGTCTCRASPYCAKAKASQTQRRTSKVAASSNILMLLLCTSPLSCLEATQLRAQCEVLRKVRLRAVDSITNTLRIIVDFLKITIQLKMMCSQLVFSQLMFDWTCSPYSSCLTAACACMCRYEKIETPSHFAIWTDPEPVTKSILTFLEKDGR